MKIVSNTGPIIGLAKVGLLFILNRLGSEVVINEGYWLSDEVIRISKKIADEI